MGIKKWTILLGVCSVLLIAGSVTTIVLRDTEGPTISFGDNKLSYTEGDDASLLLEGVTAYDRYCGDVTSSLVVESIVPLSDGKTAKVIYAARDRYNNIAKTTRNVQYIEKPSEASSEEAPEEVANKPDDSFAEFEAKAEEARRQEEELAEKEAKELAAQAEAEAAEIEAEELAKKEAEEAKKKAQQAKKRKDEEAKRKAQEEQNAQAAAANAAIPPVHSGSVSLKTNSVTIHVGDSFNPIDYVADASIDGINVINQMHISNQVNSAVPGEYKVSYAAYHADGFTTEVKTLTVKVE